RAEIVHRVHDDSRRGGDGERRREIESARGPAQRQTTTPLALGGGHGRQLVSVDRNGAVVPIAIYDNPVLSPDGHQLHSLFVETRTDNRAAHGVARRRSSARAPRIAPA